MASDFSIFATMRTAPSPRTASSRRRPTMSSAARTKLSATKSGCICTMRSRSARSLSVRLGALRDTGVTVAPRRGAISPGLVQRTSRAGSPAWEVSATTDILGVPSPMTTSDTPGRAAAHTSSHSTATVPAGVVAPATSSSSSPAASRRMGVSAARRILGPCRSARTAIGRSRSASRARTSRAVASHCSDVPCDRLMRAPSMPASPSRASMGGSAQAGPTVARILVRRGFTGRDDTPPRTGAGAAAWRGPAVIGRPPAPARGGPSSPRTCGRRRSAGTGPFPG